MNTEERQIHQAAPIIPSRIIDSHQHVFWHGKDDAGLIADMDEHKIEYAWILSWETPRSEDHPDCHSHANPLHVRSDGTHAGIPLADLLRARDRYPDRFVVGYCPCPTLPSAPELLRAAVEMYDVRVCGEWKFRTLFDDPRCLELFHAAGELGLPVVLHLDVPYRMVNGKRNYDPLWYGGTVENVARALEACPKTIFIGHGPGFWREISGSAEQDEGAYPDGPVTAGGKLNTLFERYPNLYADLSAGSACKALARDPEHAKKFLTRFDKRLFFARDYYGQDLHRCLQSLALPEESVEAIYSLNAEKLVAKP